MVMVAHTKVRLEGTIGPVSTPFETFSTGFTIHHDGDVLTQAQHDAIVARVSTFWANAGANIGDQGVLRSVKSTHVQADGLADVAPMLTNVTVAGQGAVGPIYPPQVAQAVTFRGPAAVHRVFGRMYLPCPTSPVLADGLVADAEALQTANTVRTMLAGINTDLGAGAYVGIASKYGAVRVQTVRVGKALDTIRSRRRDLPEAYIEPAAGDL